MPKKTSRAARTLQTQRGGVASGERKSAARPLIDIENSRLVAENLGTSATNGTALADESPVTSVDVAPVRVTTSPDLSQNMTSAVRPNSARRVYSRRTATTVTRQPALSREEEYAYIRTDLLTVLLLTILMVAALVVLTIILSR